MAVVGPRKRRQPQERKPVEMPIPAAGNVRREDVAAEAELEAQGVRVDPVAPAGMTAERAFFDQMEQLVFSDATLARNPQVRRLVLETSTERVTNPDGSPVMVGPEGKQTPLPGTWRQELWRHGFRKALQGDEEWAKRLWNTTYGLPRAPVELSGPGGGRIETSTRHEGLSAQEMAARFIEAQRLVEEMRVQVSVLDVEAIEVSARPPAAEATTVPVSIPSVSVMQTPTAHSQVQPAAHATGMIGRR
jgi:hypothetical protein